MLLNQQAERLQAELAAEDRKQRRMRSDRKDLAAAQKAQHEARIEQQRALAAAVLAVPKRARIGSASSDGGGGRAQGNKSARLKMPGPGKLASGLRLDMFCVPAASEWRGDGRTLPAAARAPVVDSS